MKFGFYVNNTLISSSNKWDDCLAMGCNHIHQCYERQTITTLTYLLATETWLGDKSLYTLKGKDAKRLQLSNELLEIKCIDEKIFKVTYEISFEKNADISNEDTINVKTEYLCYEDKVSKVYQTLRNDLEHNVEHDINRYKDGGSFDEMLGTLVECFEDTEIMYDVYDKYNHKSHTIKIEEVVIK